MQHINGPIWEWIDSNICKQNRIIVLFICLHTFVYIHVPDLFTYNKDSLTMNISVLYFNNFVICVLS